MVVKPKTQRETENTGKEKLETVETHGNWKQTHCFGFLPQSLKLLWHFSYISWVSHRREIITVLSDKGVETDNLTPPFILCLCQESCWGTNGKEEVGQGGGEGRGPVCQGNTSLRAYTSPVSFKMGTPVPISTTSLGPREPSSISRRFWYWQPQFFSPFSPQDHSPGPSTLEDSQCSRTFLLWALMDGVPASLKAAVKWIRTCSHRVDIMMRSRERQTMTLEGHFR